MRVTEKMVFRQSITDVSRQRSSLYDLQQQGATGKKFENLESDPIGAERVRLLRETQEAVGHYKKNIDQGRTQLDSADGALDQATNLLIRAKELALAGSTDTVSPDQRSIMADEIQSIFNSMVGIGNTRAGGEFIFGGFQTNSRPFLDDGTFVGNDGVKQVDVNQNARLTVNVSGEQGFTAAGGLDVFAEIENLRAALAADDDAAIELTLGTLDQAITQIVRARADAGLKLNQLDVAGEVRNRIEDSLRAEESLLIDIDPVKVFMEMNETSKALQSAISVAQRVTSTSFIGE